MSLFAKRAARKAAETAEEQDAETVRAIAEQVLPVAVHTGDRAFQFVHLNAGFSEVRVWPDGRVKVTRVDANGQPLPELPDLQL